MTASVAKRVVKCAGMLFRVCVRVPSYETDERDREYNYSLISDLNSVRWFLHVTSCNGTSTALVWESQWRSQRGGLGGSSTPLTDFSRT